jgi:hypothetical protein
MAVCPHLRAFLIVAIIVGGALRCPAAEPTVSWLTDRPAALTQAQKQGKLLFVVHVSSDFTKSPLESAEVKLYQTAALADARVRALLSQRFVPLLVGVGETTTLQLPRNDKAASQEAAIAYVCLPDERVLHFVPGFPSTSELLKELAWAEQCYAKLAVVPTAEQSLACRREHLQRLAPGDVALFWRRFPSRWNDSQPSTAASTVDLPEAVAAARSTVDQVLANRLGLTQGQSRTPRIQSNANQRDDQPEVLAALAAHVGASGDLAHLILAEFPLAPLSDLSRPAYAAAGGRRYFTQPKRRTELARWWADAVRSAKPTLLVVSADDYYNATSQNPAGRLFDSPQYVWPPQSPVALPHLRRFAVQVVTLDELSLLLADARLGEVRYVRERPLRFLLHDPRGFRTAELAGSEATIGRLAEVMKEN